MQCPDCGNEEHPKTAIFCVKCGHVLKPEAIRPSTELTFPCLFDLKCWLTGDPRRKGLFGPLRRGYALCFVVMPAPKQSIAVDGTLRIRIKGVLNKANVEREVPVRKADFAVRRFDLMTVSYESLSFTCHDSAPEIPVPTDGGCRIHLRLTTDNGEVLAIEGSTYFTDPEPGVGEPPHGPWTSAGDATKH